MKGTLLKFVGSVIFVLCALVGISQTTKIDSLTALIQTVSEKEQAVLYNELAQEFIYTDPNKVIFYANEALSIASRSDDREIIASAYLLLGIGNLYAGDFEKSRKFTEQGLELAQRLNNRRLILTGLNTLGAYQMNTGNYAEALDLFTKCLKDATELGFEDKAASSRLNIGTILTATGDRIRGLRYLLDALEYYEKKNDEKIESRILNNVALNYHYWKDYDKALDFYKRTQEMDKRLNDYVGLVIVLNNIGEIYKDKKEYDEAIKYYNRVIELSDSTKIGDFYKAFGWIGLAEAYLNTENYNESNRYVGLALSVFEESKMQEGISTAFLILSQISYQKGYYEQALEQITRSLDIAVQSGMIDLEQEAYKVRADIQEKLGNYKDAYVNLKKYTLITDTLYSQERTRNFTEVRSELEITQKQNEIELLQKDNQIKDLRIRKQKSGTVILSLGIIILFVVFLFMLNYIKSRKRANELLTEKNAQIREQHRELIKANDTKDKFMSIIGHDLRNPIGAFKDVIGQLSDFPEMFTDELRQQIINELRDEAESTYFLLDNLLSWAKSQKDSISYKPERLDISALIQNNLQLNFRFSETKQIKVSTEIEGEPEAYADHNMVNLVIRNLISNAIKFTEEGGQVVISAKPEGDFIRVEVKDNGIGIPAEDVPRLFNPTDHVSTYGTNHEKGSGLGLLLCKEFIEANGGTIAVQSSLGNGSTFSFTLKKYNDRI